MVHVKNINPLYFYRVHDNTMSGEILKNKLEKHTERGKKLGKYQMERESWVNRRWTVNIEDVFDEKVTAELIQTLNLLPVTMGTGAEKQLNIVREESSIVIPKSSVLVKRTDSCYKVLLRENGDFEVRAQVGLGRDISPLAYKARYTNSIKPCLEYPMVGTRKIIGCHISMANLDLKYMKDFIFVNRNCFFVFIDIPGYECKSNGEYLQNEFENCKYIGAKNFGEPYQLYSSWDAVFMPKMNSDDLKDMEYTVILGWSIGKWILYPKDNKDFKVLPFTVPYDSRNGIPSVWKCAYPKNFEDILDRYINSFSKVGRMKKVLSLCNTITQNSCVQRPDFDEPLAEESLPWPVKKKCIP
jgi:hypothetical protein